jgi:hypothetical protein
VRTPLAGSSRDQVTSQSNASASQANTRGGNRLARPSLIPGLVGSNQRRYLAQQRPALDARQVDHRLPVIREGILHRAQVVQQARVAAFASCYVNGLGLIT